ncbi:hypothetical protein Lepto7376_1811 [[Leptolyngbya] sp. PCC 7376]|uniref:hypothetical protein n=1 Tax=[Leptolyngbya] sp. PCC 7376 TaxID=111781 RepID=UPI00029F403B|nr:hypothetical protein [[Leptolyngbya] sp. PCC 7376]AFY38139.1 hypothetical protein Lepto7376_1811 [[Leptolyngbya] sp. PCC 7376]
MTHLKIQRSPQSFKDSVELMMGYVRHQMELETADKMLYFHNFAHVQGVRRRAELIFDAVRPHWQAELNQLHDSLDLERMRGLLSLAAIAHDMVQEFLPLKPWQARRREMGVSENKTIDKLLGAIAELNADLANQHPDRPELQFSDADCEVLREAISATICDFDPSDRAIFQPYLYTDEEKSKVAVILALADIGALVVEGIDAFRQEGREIFLEENLDFVPLVLHPQEIEQYPHETKIALRDNLLGRARFQIGFATGRINRLAVETSSLPAQSLVTLQNEVFSYANQRTLEELKTTTPTSSDTSLEELLNYFRFDRIPVTL